MFKNTVVTFWRQIFTGGVCVCVCVCVYIYIYIHIFFQVTFGGKYKESRLFNTSIPSLPEA